MAFSDLDQWPRLSALLDELLELDGAAQADRLAQLRAQEPEIAQAVMGLLDRLTSIDRDGFLLQPPTLPDEATGGQTVGAYALERELGQGGMGTVWLARRTDGRFEGQVAIKFLAAGFATRAGVARFTREGSVLARLSHPHIARLLDAGLAPGNRPYLVLDFVDGVAIDLYCQQAGLDTPARVRLCLDVLDAVAHAHTRLILHRDIKPNNILVTRSGEVKLLDFGIAKLLGDSGDLAAATALTRESGHAFTPLYAAPEQVQGGEVSTATDVHALGMLLHVLLTGLHPGSAAATPLARLQQVLEADAPPMSVALRAASPGDAAAAQRARLLRGDLDTIVAKALKKQPGERYNNAAQLADDLRRWLADEPILARRDAPLYTVRKFVRRHRAGVAAGGLVVSALAGGVGVALWQAAEAKAQRVEAEGLIEFMLGDLRGKLQPVGRLDALDAVGERALAYYAKQQAGQLDAESLGRRSRALHLIGEIAETRGKLDDAVRRFSEAERSTAALLARAPQDAQRLFDHAQSVYWVGYIATRQGRLAEAEGRFRRYEALAERLIAIDPGKPAWQLELAFAQQNLGTVMLNSNRVAEAREMLLQAQLRFKALAAGDPGLTAELGNNMSWLARTDERLGRIGVAIDSLQARTALLQAQPGAATDRSIQRDIGATANEMSRLELLRGRPQPALLQAEAALSSLLPLGRLDPDNTLWQRDLVGAHVRLADARLALGSEPATLRAAADQALALTRRLLARDASASAWRVNLLGLAWLVQAHGAPTGQRQEAIQGLTAWLASVEPKPVDTSGRPIVCQAALLVGDDLATRGHDEAARPHWTRAAAQVAADDPTPDLMATACAVQAHGRLGQTQAAQRWALHLQATEFKHPAHAAYLQAVASR